MGFFGGDRMLQHLAAHTAQGRVMREFHFDEAEERSVIKYTQDVEPVLERNAALRSENPSGMQSHGEYQYVASVPAVVMHQWLQQGIKWWDPDDTPKILRMLNDPEWSKLRTSDGRA